MKRKIIYVLLVLVILCQQSGYAKIYCKIKGQVIDEETKQGIPDVYVNAHLSRHDSPLEYYVLTDENGYFIFSNLIPGRYELFYNPLYPYVTFPDQEYLRDMGMEYPKFLINEGEIKHVVQELRRGGEIILNIKLENANLAEYEAKKSYLDRIEGGKLKIDILTIYSKFSHPGFNQATIGKKKGGLAPGEYIICQSFKKRPKYYSGNDVEYAGIIRTFSLEKMEQKTIDLDYNSKSKIILNIQNNNGNKFHDGWIFIYKQIEVNGNMIYYKVWDYENLKNETINPIIIEPGNYFIKFYLVELIGQAGNIIEFEDNEFLFDIGEGQKKVLNFVLSINGKKLPGIEDLTFIH